MNLLSGSDLLLLLKSINSLKGIIKRKKNKTMADNKELVRLHEIEDLLIKRKIDML